MVIISFCSQLLPELFTIFLVECSQLTQWLKQSILHWPSLIWLTFKSYKRTAEIKQQILPPVPSPFSSCVNLGIHVGQGATKTPLRSPESCPLPSSETWPPRGQYDFPESTELFASSAEFLCSLLMKPSLISWRQLSFAVRQQGARTEDHTNLTQKTARSRAWNSLSEATLLNNCRRAPHVINTNIFCTSRKNFGWSISWAWIIKTCFSTS